MPPKVGDSKIPKLGTKSPTETQKSATSARLDSLALQVANIADVLVKLQRQLSEQRGTFDSSKLREVPTGPGGQIAGKAEFPPTGGNDPNEARALESTAVPVAMEGKRRQPLVDLGDAFPGWTSASSVNDSETSVDACALEDGEL